MTTTLPSPRRRGLLPRTSAVLVSVGLALSSTVSTASAAPLRAGEVAAVSGFLADQLAASGDHVVTTFDGTSYPDYGLTADAVFALGALDAGREQAARSTAFLRSNVGAYIGTDGETYAGASGKLLTLAVTQGVSPTSFGGADLVARVQSTLTASGRFSDVSQWGDYSNTLGQSWALLGLERAGRSPAPAAVGFLRDQQCADGGFRLDLAPAGGACASDPDATSLAVQALVAVAGRGDADVTEATAYLATRSGADGGVGGAGPTAAPNANSTGLAAAAFAAAGRDDLAQRTRSYLGGLYFGCDAPAPLRGAVAYDAAGRSTTEPTDQLRRSTAQAALGLSGQSYVTVTAAGDAAGPVALDCSPAGSGSPGSTGSVGAGSSGTGSLGSAA